MDTNYINTVVDGSTVVCSNCSAGNELEAVFCWACGHPLKEKKTEKELPFETIKQESIICPKCGIKNTSDAKFCAKCGSRLEQIEACVSKTDETNDLIPKEDSSEKEKRNQIWEQNTFAQGLPEWSLEPPQVMVRRKRK